MSIPVVSVVISAAVSAAVSVALSAVVSVALPAVVSVVSVALPTVVSAAVYAVCSDGVNASVAASAGIVAAFFYLFWLAYVFPVGVVRLGGIHHDFHSRILVCEAFVATCLRKRIYKVVKFGFVQDIEQAQ